MNEQFFGAIREHRQQIVERTLEELSRGKEYVPEEVLKDSQLKPIITEVLDLIELVDEQQEQRLQNFFRGSKRLTWSIVTVLHIFDCIGLSIYRLMDELNIVDELPKDRQLIELEKRVIPIRNRFVQLHVDLWESTVEVQRLALKELTAPLIPIFDKISVMPIVGTVDTERAKLIIENLLHGAVSHKSEVVLIDITAVPVVDTMVAHYMMQAVEALRLVGTRSMLVGIRPEIAQTIVNLGVQMHDFETESTLQRGVEKALRSINRKIIEVKDS